MKKKKSIDTPEEIEGGDYIASMVHSANAEDYTYCPRCGHTHYCVYPDISSEFNSVVQEGE